MAFHGLRLQRAAQHTQRSAWDMHFKVLEPLYSSEITLT